MISEIQKVTQTFEAIVCVAGGFECSNISDISVFDDLQLMNFKNVESALLASHLATKFLAPKGLLLLTGSSGVYDGPLNFAFGYHLSKTALHSMADLMHAELGKSLPPEARVVCLLPGVLDTPSNRASWMQPDPTWILPESLAKQIVHWASCDERVAKFIKISGDPKSEIGL